jgi:hypothetical protein
MDNSSILDQHIDNEGDQYNENGDYVIEGILLI